MEKRHWAKGCLRGRGRSIHRKFDTCSRRRRNRHVSKSFRGVGGGRWRGLVECQLEEEPGTNLAALVQLQVETGVTTDQAI